MEQQPVIVWTFEDAQVYATQILESAVLMVGFDTETSTERVEHPNKTSLISIALDDQRIYLFQIYRIWARARQERLGQSLLETDPQKWIPSALKKLLMSEKIIKVGVGLNHDVEQLWESYGIHTRGWIDIQYLTRTMKIPQSSMSDLCQLPRVQALLPGLSEKDPYGHRGDWDTNLDPRQIAYASDDAKKSLYLYIILMNLDCTDVITTKTTNKQEDQNLLRWVQVELQRAVTARSFDSIVNQIANSYGPWRNRYIETERKQMATDILNRLIENAQLQFDPLQHRFIPPVKPDEVIIDPTPEEIDLAYKEFGPQIAGMKIPSAINKLANSYARWGHLSLKTRQHWAQMTMDSFLKTGRF